MGILVGAGAEVTGGIGVPLEEDVCEVTFFRGEEIARPKLCGCVASTVCVTTGESAMFDVDLMVNKDDCG